MNIVDYSSYRDKLVDSTSSSQYENNHVYDYSGNYAVSPYNQGIEIKKDINQDMKRAIEVAKTSVITMSENEKKEHDSYTSKSSKPVQLGNPTIKGKTKTRLSKKTIWIIVIGSLLVLMLLIGGIIYVYNEILVCNGLKATDSLYFRRKTCNYAPYFKPSSKLLVKSITIEENSFIRAKSFRVDGLKLLRSISILQSSFTRVGYRVTETEARETDRHFGVLNCPQLTSIGISSYSFAEWDGEFELKNLPALEFIQIGSRKYGDSYSFYHNTLSMNGTQG